MDQPVAESPRQAPRKQWRPPSWSALWLVGSLLLWFLYATVFLITTSNSLWTALRDSFANAMPAAALAAAVHELLKAWVMPRTLPVQILAHFGLSLAFASSWYALTIVATAFFSGITGGNSTIEPFSGMAATWQSFQGLILYGFVAATCYAIRGGREASVVTIVDQKPLDRYLVRDDDGMHPIDVSEIITITGAQDYSEVATRHGVHLVRMSLGEFEARLDETRFLRVHRSAIINFRQLIRTETVGGGRMIASMSNGETIQVSRAGAKLLRTLVV